jgi:putative ABC transport system substrate-binding protein
VSLQIIENKALSWGIIRKSACIHDEITIWKSQLPWISVAANARWIAELAVQRQLPTIFRNRVFTDAGGFMTYGASRHNLYRRVAYYVDRILQGTKPADLPVEQATTFELVINLNTAKTLGLTIPPTLLFQADKVIR